MTFLLPICGNTPKAFDEAVAAWALADGRQIPDRSLACGSDLGAPSGIRSARDLQRFQRLDVEFSASSAERQAPLLFGPPALKEEV